MSIVRFIETAASAYIGVVAKCATCGAELDDVSQRFCGGDRCRRVFLTYRAVAGPDGGSGVARWETTHLADGGHGSP